MPMKDITFLLEDLSRYGITYCIDFHVLHCMGLYCVVVAETCSYQEPLVASVNDVSAVDSTGSDATSAVQGSGQIWVSRTTVSDTIRFTINSVDVPTIAVVSFSIKSASKVTIAVYKSYLEGALPLKEASLSFRDSLTFSIIAVSC